MKNFKYILFFSGEAAHIYDNLNDVYQDIIKFKLQVGEYTIFKGEEIT